MGLTAVMGRPTFDQAVQTFHVMGEAHIGFDKLTTCRSTVFRMFLLLVGLGESLTNALAHGAGQHRGGSTCLDSMLCILSGASPPGQAAACIGGSMAMYSSSGVCLFSAPAQV